MSNVICTDDRFEVIAKYKAKLLEKTNIETSADEMAVIDNILFRMWQIGWLDRLEQPTISAVPVVHGYWRPHPLGYTSNLVKYEEWDVCSNCGIGTKRRNMTDDFFEEYSYSYCPWCGAKMDAKEGIEE